MSLKALILIDAYFTDTQVRTTERRTPWPLLVTDSGLIKCVCVCLELHGEIHKSNSAFGAEVRNLFAIF